MTIYLKNFNGVPTPAPNVFQDETGFYPAFNQSVEAMTTKGYVAFDEDDYAQYLIGAKTFVNDAFIDDPTEAYTADQKAATKASLQSQLDELDKKRIRAGFEPSVKDEAIGQTWLQYYTSQIRDLREQLSQLD